MCGRAGAAGRWKALCPPTSRRSMSSGRTMSTSWEGKRGGGGGGSQPFCTCRSPSGCATFAACARAHPSTYVPLPSAPSGQALAPGTARDKPLRQEGSDTPRPRPRPAPTCNVSVAKRVSPAFCFCGRGEGRWWVVQARRPQSPALPPCHHHAPCSGCARRCRPPPPAHRTVSMYFTLSSW